MSNPVLIFGGLGGLFWGIAFFLIYNSVPEFNDLVGKYSALTIIS